MAICRYARFEMVGAGEQNDVETGAPSAGDLVDLVPLRLAVPRRIRKVVRWIAE